MSKRVPGKKGKKVRRKQRLAPKGGIKPPHTPFTLKKHHRDIIQQHYDEDIRGDYIYWARSYIGVQLRNLGYPKDVVERGFAKTQRGDTWGDHVEWPPPPHNIRIPGRGRITIKRRIGEENLRIIKQVVQECRDIEGDFRTYHHSLNHELLLDSQRIAETFNMYIPGKGREHLWVNSHTPEWIWVLQHQLDLLAHLCKLSYEIHVIVRPSRNHNRYFVERFSVVRLDKPKEL